jgi:hypothetical protein
MQREDGGFGLAFRLVQVTEFKSLAVIQPEFERMLGEAGRDPRGSAPVHARL